jgi:hypothetical protein
MSTPSVTPSIDDVMRAFGGKASDKLQQEDRLKIALVGDTGVGKSWLLSTAPKPIMEYDFDDRAESLAGKPGLIIKSKPTMVDIERDLSIAKANKSAGKSHLNPATWGFDSVTYMQRAMEDEIFRQAPDLARTIKVGTSLGMKLRKNWDTINGIQRYVEYLIAEFSQLGNIIFVFHEKNEKDPVKSTAENTAYTGDITVSPQYLSQSLSLFNEVYRIKQDLRGKYEVQCKYTGVQDKFSAKTTMLLDATEPPDLMAMIEKHKKARAAQQIPKP